MLSQTNIPERAEWLADFFVIELSAEVIDVISNTYMKELVLYWIQYKNSLKYKVSCFRPFSYVYTIN